MHRVRAEVILEGSAIEIDGAVLESVHVEWHRERIPRGCEYGSRCMLEVEASMHGTSLFA